MNRRTFLQLGSCAAVATAFTWTSCSSRGSRAAVLRTPFLLSHICDEETILALGKEFHRKFPDAGNQKAIETQLQIGLTGQQLSEQASPGELEELLLQKVDRDFNNGELIVLKGWVLAKTEALQCALLSIPATS